MDSHKKRVLVIYHSIQSHEDSWEWTQRKLNKTVQLRLQSTNSKARHLKLKKSHLPVQSCVIQVRLFNLCALISLQNCCENLISMYVKCLHQSQACNKHYSIMDIYHYYHHHHSLQCIRGWGRHNSSSNGEDATEQLKTAVNNSFSICTAQTLPYSENSPQLVYCQSSNVNCKKGAIFYQVEGEAKTTDLQKEMMKLTHKTNWERGGGRGERQREKLLWFPTILQS